MRNASVGSPIRATVASNVRAELARAGVSQSAAAAWIGVTQPAMSARLHGKVALTVDELAAIAEGLGIPVASLLEELPFRGLASNGRERTLTPEYGGLSTVTQADLALVA